MIWETMEHVGWIHFSVVSSVWKKAIEELSLINACKYTESINVDILKWCAEIIYLKYVKISIQCIHYFYGNKQCTGYGLIFVGRQFLEGPINEYQNQRNSTFLYFLRYDIKDKNFEPMNVSYEFNPSKIKPFTVYNFLEQVNPSIQTTCYLKEDLKFYDTGKCATCVKYALFKKYI